MSKYREIFGKNLAHFIRERGLNQTSFAELVETSQSQVSSYANGKIEPGLDLIVRWAHALKVEPADLLSEIRTGNEREKLALISLVLGADKIATANILRVLGPYLTPVEQKKSSGGA